MNPSFRPGFSLASKLSLLGVVLLLGGVALSVTTAMKTQQSQSSAWMTDQSATAVCDDGMAAITVSFTNTETSSSLAMNVTVQDIGTGKTVDLGTITAQQTKSGTINTGESSALSGGVIYYLTWANGTAGTDQRNAAYTGITCGEALEPTTYQEPSPTMTPVPSEIPTVTPSPIPTTVPTLVPSITPVPSINTGFTTLSLNLLLDGIGMAGDRVSPGTEGNMDPLHPTRSVQVELFDASNNLAASVSGDVTFASASGSFIGIVDLGQDFASGLYTVKVTTPQYLRAIVPGIQTILSGQDNQLPATSLIAGDINGDNEINIVDYNVLIGCYSDLLPPVSCTPANEMLADLNDDGAVNQFDYNLFLRELSNVQGE
jgi:Dockerin type I domain